VNRNQADRARIAARAAARDIQPSRNVGAVSTDPALRGSSIAPYGFTGTRRHGNKARMTDAQRDSRGRFSDWNRSPFTPRGGWR
jgi:hypothetical protein